ERLGLPSLHTGHWDPFLAACAETETVVCLHVGSSSSAPATSSGAPSDTIGVLFFGWAMFSAVDWLYSKVALRFPDLKLCLSQIGGFPRDEIESLAWRNASELFHHPVPEALQRDPYADLQAER